MFSITNTNTDDDFGGKEMVVIEVQEKDMDKVFGILSGNGRFTGLPGNKFRIDENGQQTLNKIKEAGIEVKVISE